MDFIFYFLQNNCVSGIDKWHPILRKENILEIREIKYLKGVSPLFSMIPRYINLTRV